jgi:DNA-binding CsgD family transcriptional regulator
MQQHLSPRERQVVALVTTGVTNKEIAHNLGISPKTVTNVLTRVFAKTGAQSRTQLAVQVVQSGFLARA